MRIKFVIVCFSLLFITNFVFAYNEKSFKEEKFANSHIELLNKQFYLITDIKKTTKDGDIESLPIYILHKLNAHFEKYEQNTVFYTLDYILLDKDGKEYTFSENRVTDTKDFIGRTYANKPKFDSFYIEKGTFSLKYSNGYSWFLGHIDNDITIKSGDNARIFSDEIYGKVLDWNLVIFSNQPIEITQRNTRLELYYGETIFILNPTNSITAPLEWPDNFKEGYALVFQLNGYKVDEIYQKNLFWKASFNSMITDKDIVNKSYDYMTKLVHGTLVIGNRKINLDPLFSSFSTVEIVQ